ncbi:MAG: UvrD-helicase domain-containing protein [Rhodopila sp.]
MSAFVAASAGSGKTKLLTDRLLRLMLTGAAPERIQCLTFTKAAAAEMSLRLQRTLGRWVTMAPDELAGELARLLVEPTAATCQAARALFAKVLDLPGGMRIGTIHAFSQSLLRRFPLEAAISPHFQLVDDRDADDALTEAREDMLTSAGSAAMQHALRTLAGLCSADAFGGHVKTLQSDRLRLQAALQLGDELEGGRAKPPCETRPGSCSPMARKLSPTAPR